MSRQSDAEYEKGDSREAQREALARRHSCIGRKPEHADENLLQRRELVAVRTQPRRRTLATPQDVAFRI
jgi:hypothetical protein